MEQNCAAPRESKEAECHMEISICRWSVPDTKPFQGWSFGPSLWHRGKGHGPAYSLALLWNARWGREGAIILPDPCGDHEHGGRLLMPHSLRTYIKAKNLTLCFGVYCCQIPSSPLLKAQFCHLYSSQAVFYSTNGPMDFGRHPGRIRLWGRSSVLGPSFGKCFGVLRDERWHKNQKQNYCKVGKTTKAPLKIVSTWAGPQMLHGSRIIYFCEQRVLFQSYVDIFCCTLFRTINIPTPKYEGALYFLTSSQESQKVNKKPCCYNINNPELF